jgi:hypothetical protein
MCVCMYVPIHDLHAQTQIPTENMSVLTSDYLDNGGTYIHAYTLEGNPLRSALPPDQIKNRQSVIAARIVT